MNFKGTQEEFDKYIKSLKPGISFSFHVEICKNCKHWERQKPKIKCEIGLCRELGNYFNYYDGLKEAIKQMEKGKILCENLFTHKDFGCIHFEKI